MLQPFNVVKFGLPVMQLAELMGSCSYALMRRKPFCAFDHPGASAT